MGLSQVTLRGSTREKLRRAHDLLAGSVPFGDHDRVIDQALDALMSRLEKRKSGATSKPRVRTKPNENPRTIPAEVRRAVFARDGGRCTFVGPTGHRCESRVVELDHIVPIARGGTSTISNVRLLCRPHNQLEAERAFGRDFMERQRAAAPKPRERPEHADLVSGLRGLGYRISESREAAGFAMQLADASMEERMRAALAWFRPRPTSTAAP